MVVTPAAIPVTLPNRSTVPIATALLLQLPPGVASNNVIVWPRQTLFEPNIPDGNGLTVIMVLVLHPAPVVYVIVTGTGIVINVTTPVTRPDEEPIVAVNVSLLLQVPPLLASLNKVVDPWQIFGEPVMGT